VGKNHIILLKRFAQVVASEKAQKKEVILGKRNNLFLVNYSIFSSS